MTDAMTATTPKPAWQHAALAAILVIGAASLGNLTTIPNIPGWYATLQKPFFSPPNWVFGPVWTLLYGMMGYAFFRILRLPPATAGRSLAIIMFCVQLALNAVWPLAFFGMKSPVLGMVVIVPLLIAIILTIRAFWQPSRISALLLLPYLAWVCFATALNTALWQINS
jgi:translocator protein